MFKLKPCPFCGCDADTMVLVDSWVRCTNHACETFKSGKTMEDAVKKWNKRDGQNVFFVKRISEENKNNDLQTVKKAPALYKDGFTYILSIELFASEVEAKQFKPTFELVKFPAREDLWVEVKVKN